MRTDEPVDHARALHRARSDWTWLGDEEREWLLGRTASSLWSTAPRA